MASMNLYSTLRWRVARSRAIERDGKRCTVARLLGGTCAPGPLHVHHIVPVADGGALYDLENLGTSCASHHPTWESLRRILVSRRSSAPAPAPRCPHKHRSEDARRICERRMARARGMDTLSEQAA